MTGRVFTMRVTEKRHVTVPKDVRDRFGIGAGTEVVFEVENDEILVHKVSDGPTRGDQLAARPAGAVTWR